MCAFAQLCHCDGAFGTVTRAKVNGCKCKLKNLCSSSYNANAVEVISSTEKSSALHRVAAVACKDKLTAYYNVTIQVMLVPSQLSLILVSGYYTADVNSTDHVSTDEVFEKVDSVFRRHYQRAFCCCL